MKIAFTSTYSYPSASGVWNYVYNVAKELIKKEHEVHVFSSNLIAGTDKTSSTYELFEGVHLHRFPAKLKLSENVSIWNPYKDLIKLKPDVIHCNTYRHPETLSALKAAKKLKIPCFLTTHAPFVESELRNPIQNIGAYLYDIFKKQTLNHFTKVIAITDWELPYLYGLGCKKENVEVIPTGISDIFLKIKPRGSQIIYAGRISRIKNIQLLIEAVKEMPNVKIKIIGPVDSEYKLPEIPSNVELVNKKYNLKEELKEFGKSKIYITSSNREGSPQTLLEAMAAGLLVISADNKGAKEIIGNDRGLLFRKGNKKDLIAKLNWGIEDYDKYKSIIKNAKRFAEKRTWNKLAGRLEKIYLNFI